MAVRGDTPASSRLRRLAQRPRDDERQQVSVEERCELCGELIGADHRHLVDLSSRALMCSCRPCSLLFDQQGAGGGRYRLVPDRRLLVEGFELDDALWQSLRIPVDMAFFFHSSQAERVAAFYPGPAGATESLLGLEAWREIETANPMLEQLEPDVEALLVNRAESAHGHWLVPIDDCYDLVGLIRRHWKGLSGGREVWTEINGFFARLGQRAKAVDREGTRQRASMPAAGAAGNGKEPAWGT